MSRVSIVLVFCTELLVNPLSYLRAPFVCTESDKYSLEIGKTGQIWPMLYISPIFWENALVSAIMAIDDKQKAL